MKNQVLNIVAIAAAVSVITIGALGCSTKTPTTTSQPPPTSSTTTTTSKPPTTTTNPPPTTSQPPTTTTQPPPTTSTQPPHTTTVVPPPTTTPVATNLVVIGNYAFMPQTITIPVGSTVTWQNQDMVDHTVTSDTSGIFDSVVTAGGTTRITFVTKGTYAYHCSIHPEMTGTIIVQ